jgi:recA bacterial DNA recombination protein
MLTAVVVNRSMGTSVVEGTTMGLAEAEYDSEIAASLAALRRSTMRWLLRESHRACLTTGVAALDDALAGGWPCGRIGELIGPVSTGRTSIAAATVATATRAGAVAAWIDLTDALDPDAARAAGIVLERVLWVRPTEVEEAVRVAELVLEGGFSVVVVDLVGWRARGREGARARRHGETRAGSSTASSRGRGGGGSALQLRLTRAVERADAVALVLTDRSWAGTLAGITVSLQRGAAVWGGRHGAPRWLAGLTATPWLARGGVGPVGRDVALRPRQGARTAAAPSTRGHVTPAVDGRADPTVPAAFERSPLLALRPSVDFHPAAGGQGA